MQHMISAPGAFAVGVAIFLIVLWDAFEAIILPRRVTRKFRLARLFYRSTWKTWRFMTALIPSRKAREASLGFYGPLSLLVLVGVWAVGLVLGFGLMQYGAGSAVVMAGGQPGFLTDIYLSGTTFLDRKSTRLNSSHLVISYAVLCLKKKNRRSRRHRGRHNWEGPRIRPSRRCVSTSLTLQALDHLR